MTNDRHASHQSTFMKMVDAIEARRSPRSCVLGNVTAEDALEAIRAALAAAPAPQEPRTDHIRSVPGGAAFLRVAASPAAPQPDFRALLGEARELLKVSSPIRYFGMTWRDIDDSDKKHADLIARINTALVAKGDADGTR